MHFSVGNLPVSLLDRLLVPPAPSGITLKDLHIQDKCSLTKMHHHPSISSLPALFHNILTNYNDLCKHLNFSLYETSLS